MKVNFFVCLIIVISFGIFVDLILFGEGVISLILVLIASEINKLRVSK